MIKKLLLFAVAIVAALTGAARLSAQTGLNGTNARPFYVMGHNPNTLDDALSAMEGTSTSLLAKLQTALAKVQANDTARAGRWRRSSTRSRHTAAKTSAWLTRTR